MEDVAREPGRVELLRRERRRDPAVGRERAVAVADDRDDDAGRARATGADQLDSVRGELARDELPRRVVPRFAMQRASAPSSAAQAATLAAWPPAPARFAARTSPPGASGSAEHARPRRAIRHRMSRSARHNRPMDGERTRESARLPAGRGRRRLGRGRGCPPPPDGRRRREQRLERPAGLAAFEGAPCFEELLEEHAAGTRTVNPSFRIALRREC